jgi:hypothetical protein
MRKELTVYIDMVERGEEVLLQRTRNMKGFITVKPTTGNSFVIKKEDLLAGLEALAEFDGANPEESAVETQVISEFNMEVTLGED